VLRAASRRVRHRRPVVTERGDSCPVPVCLLCSSHEERTCEGGGRLGWVLALVKVLTLAVNPVNLALTFGCETLTVGRESPWRRGVRRSAGSLSLELRSRPSLNHNNKATIHVPICV
jgi:hypothetical protein